MNPVLMAPFSTPSSAWEGFQSPLVKFQHGDFFAKGGTSTVKVCVLSFDLVDFMMINLGRYIFNVFLLFLSFVGASQVPYGLDRYEHCHAPTCSRPSGGHGPGCFLEGSAAGSPRRHGAERCLNLKR